MTLPRAAVLALLLPCRAPAMEVSLEENRAERGSIGYVDIQKVFRLFPQTHKAKQSFQEIVRQAEEQVNLGKAELIALRSEISRMTIEMEILRRTPIPAIPRPVQPPAPAAETSTEAVVSSSSPAVSTSAPAGIEGLALPGMAKPLGASEPSLSPPSPGLEPPPAPDMARASATLEAGSSLLPPSAAGRWAVSPATAAFALAESDLAAAAAHAREAQMRDLKARLESKRAELEAKEAAHEKHKARIEKNLLELESRRTEILLGKIYSAMQEVARENNVGVVIDKSQILYGQSTVDLTEKTIRKLESMP
jgi:Skp family chaperone for outer membrane proteins